MPCDEAGGRRASTFGIKGTLQHESAWPGRPASVDQLADRMGYYMMGRRNFGACIYDNFQRVDGAGLALCYVKCVCSSIHGLGSPPYSYTDVNTHYMSPIIIFPCHRPDVSLHRASFFSCF